MSFAKEVYKSVPENIRYTAYFQLYSRNISNPDMFTSVDVGLDDWCNRRCSYCPVSTTQSRHKKGGEVLFTQAGGNLLRSLGRINYCGQLQPVHFNEPLLRAEEALFPFFEEAQKLVPRAQLKLITNGDVLPHT